MHSMAQQTRKYYLQDDSSDYSDTDDVPLSILAERFKLKQGDDSKYIFHVKNT